MKAEPQRFIENVYPDYSDGMATYNEKELLVRVETQLQKALAELTEKCPPASQATYESTGKKSLDLTMYTGSFGNVFVQWRLYQLAKARQDQARMAEFLSTALVAFKVNAGLLEKHGKKHSHSSGEEDPSFFMGKSGLYTLGALLYREAGKAAEMLGCYKAVLSALALCKLPTAEDELLYGNAGYLYCLLALYKTDPGTFDCKAEIREVMGLLKAVGGAAGKGGILIFPFPRSKSTFYYGAAHGLFGILYVLMKAIEVTGAITDPDLLEMIKKTCEQIVKAQFPTGNFPPSFGEGSKDKLVHFCHGAPGAIPMLLQAHKMFGDEAFLTAALNAGEAVWNRGILLKGNGLCHGIAGNAYMLHALYAYTNDVRWKYRCHMFADASWNESVQKAVKVYKDPTRLTAGMPDTPYSLMEGLGGSVVFYADLLHDMPDMRFPGYEL